MSSEENQPSSGVERFLTDYQFPVVEGTRQLAAFGVNFIEKIGTCANSIVAAWLFLPRNADEIQQDMALEWQEFQHRRSDFTIGAVAISASSATLLAISKVL